VKDSREAANDAEYYEDENGKGGGRRIEWLGNERQDRAQA
jgi:hypothetical protein